MASRLRARPFVGAVAVAVGLLGSGCGERSGNVGTGHVGTGHVGTGHVGTGHVGTGHAAAAPTSTTAPSAPTSPAAGPAGADPLGAGATAVDTATFTGSVAVNGGVVWVSHDSGTIDRLDGATGGTLGTLAVRNGSFAARPAFGFGSMWFTTDLDDTLWRVDATTGEVQASLRVPGDVLDNAAMSFAPVTVTEEAVWVVSSDRAGSTLHRVDPASATITGSLPAPVGANNVAYGFGSFWLTTRQNRLVRLDPLTGQTLADVALGKYARTLRFGFDSVWTQAVVDGVDTIVRVDPATNTVVATIPLHPAVDWSLWRVDFAFAASSVWTCTSETPLVRIDPGTNAIVARFGEGSGGCAVAAADGAVWFGAYAGRQLYRLPLP